MRLLSLFALHAAAAVICSISSVAAWQQDSLVSEVFDVVDSSSSGSGIYDSSGPDDGGLPTDTPSISPSPTPAPTVPQQDTDGPWEICPKGQEEMSVEGVEGIFCVPYGKGCSGDRADGKCPGRQTGLPHGSYCGRVASGVLGCKPYFPWMDKTDPDPDHVQTNPPTTEEGSLPSGNDENDSLAGSNEDCVDGSNEDGSLGGNEEGSLDGSNEDGSFDNNTKHAPSHGRLRIVRRVHAHA